MLYSILHKSVSVLYNVRYIIFILRQFDWFIPLLVQTEYTVLLAVQCTEMRRDIVYTSQKYSAVERLYR